MSQSADLSQLPERPGGMTFSDAAQACRDADVDICAQDVYYLVVRRRVARTYRRKVVTSIRINGPAITPTARDCYAIDPLELPALLAAARKLKTAKPALDGGPLAD